MITLAERTRKHNRQKAFWESMADRYPLPFEKKTLEDTQKIIAIAEEGGVQVHQATILDIGCGTGIYTLPLAQRALQVTGIDSSEKMLGYCKRERATHHLDNVRILQMDWQENVESLGFAGGFDIAWASMTPAIRTGDDVAKMRQCARKSCVYIGWGKLRKNDLLEEVFIAHNQIFGPPPGAAAIRAILEKQGICPLTTPVQTSWDWQGSLEEACGNAAGYLEASLSETEVQYDIIENIVSRHARDGKVSHTTHVEMEVLVWHES